MQLGELPNGETCLATDTIGLFTIGLIKEAGLGPGYAVIYSFDQTRLECYEYNSDERAQATNDYMRIRVALHHAQACFNSKLIEVFKIHEH